MWLKFVLVFIFGCTNILTEPLDLGGVMSGNRMAGVPLGRSLGDGEVDVEGICSETGVACQNCTHAVTCIALPLGWLKVPLQECSHDQSCNAHAGGCSTQHATECTVVTQKYEHTCEQVGIFPDAYDCRKFHLCSPPTGSPSGSPADHRVAMCPRNYGYNPLTAQCSIKLYKGQCHARPVPDCNMIGDYGVLPTSPNHYYVCLSKQRTIYPQIFLCPHGWFFVDGFCRPDQPAETTPASTTPAFTTTSAVTTTAARTTTPEVATTETPIYYRFGSLFSTDKTTTLKPDTFLADKFDMTLYNNYDNDNTADQVSQFEDVNSNSWEQFK